MSFRRLALAAVLAGLAAPAFAQPAPMPTASPAFVRSYEQAILANLDAPTRAEVTRRATGGNSVHEVLQVILLNNLQLADAPNARVIAVDFVREVAVLEVPGQTALRILPFNTTNLTLKR